MNAVARIDLPQAWRTKHLTPAEQRVIELVAAGLVPKEVAARLNRSPATIRNPSSRKAMTRQATSTPA